VDNPKKAQFTQSNSKNAQNTSSRCLAQNLRELCRPKNCFSEAPFKVFLLYILAQWFTQWRTMDQHDSTMVQHSCTIVRNELKAWFNQNNL
jgi:hypothetical protein